MASLACQMARATQAAKELHSSTGPAGCSASCSTAPLTSASPSPPMASRIATSPISRCRTPLTANPARATSSSVRELVMSSAASAASFSSLLMIDPSTDSVVLPDRSSARFVL